MAKSHKIEKLKAKIYYHNENFINHVTWCTVWRTWPLIFKLDSTS